MMKCLSLKQPYSFLLSTGKKTIELRKWNTNFRGEFLIHASKNVDAESCTRLKIDKNKLIIGSIIGSAFLYGVNKYEDKQDFVNDSNKHFANVSRYDEGYKYGFLIKDAKTLKKSVPYLGRLGFFEIDTLKLNIHENHKIL
ncbi:MAG: ASCH domain-containing protein [Nitrososphaeraceae archaeon]